MISNGNPVKFARFVLLAVSEEAKTWLPFFCDIQINQGQGRGYQPPPAASPDNPYRDQHKVCELDVITLRNLAPWSYMT